ncbi:MAG: hypothetical protein JST12_08865 [Armatimonadetes bacterium]|nr:hypothetical protein [Armatimonadota bacterium]
MDTKRILSAAARSKEHPNCRREIVKHGLRPSPTVSNWDGTAVGLKGQNVFISGLMRTQMARMINEGYWESVD